MQHNEVITPALRVSQWESTILDGELLNLLRDPIVRYLARYISVTNEAPSNSQEGNVDINNNSAWDIEDVEESEDNVDASIAAAGLSPTLVKRIDLLLKIIIFSFSTLRNLPTPGERLQNICYVYATKTANGSKSMKYLRKVPLRIRLLKGFLSILLPYFCNFISEQIEDVDESIDIVTDEGRRVQTNLGLQGMKDSPLQFIRSLMQDYHKQWLRYYRRTLRLHGPFFKKLYRTWQKLFGVLSFVNTLIFLRNGIHHSLVDRFLSLRLVEAQTGNRVGRLISYEFMNRELVWQEITKFFLFLATFVNWNNVQRVIRRLRIQVRANACEV
eukprot:g968.t1